ncbi:MAG TPA: hypothetical protein VMQ60_07120 [Acidobacteriaceae bacterium]|jgi:hypothetical protein|nr:hypothetical protein [Acidobacteriaceae bacterium]
MVEFDVTKDESCAATDCKESPLMSAVRRERDVRTIQNDDGAGDEHGPHSGSLCSSACTARKRFQ